MPIRYGVSFPAWFSVNYPPSPPVKPKVPQQIFYEDVHVFIERHYIENQPINSLIEIMKHYNSDNFIVKNECENFFEIYRIDKKEVILDEKEYNKALKEYDKKVKEYEKAYFEYESRMKKYPSLLLQHESAKYTTMLADLEDELIELQIQNSNKILSINEVENSIKECKKNLEEIQKKAENEIKS